MNNGEYFRIHYESMQLDWPITSPHTVPVQSENQRKSDKIKKK